MGAHTPGPWHLHNGAFALVCAARKAICAMKNIHSDDNEANARLIAAAPDLLEAARKALQSAEREKAAELPVADGRLRDAAIHDLRAAIALATGGHR